MPGFTLPPDWTPADPVPLSLILPPGVDIPDGWLPGDPLPEGAYIDTSIYFPDGWQPGDPLPPSLILPPGVILPGGWLPGDPLPEGAYIDTSIYFPPDWSAGDPPPPEAIPDAQLPPGIDDPADAIPPDHLAPFSPGPTRRPSGPSPAPGWFSTMGPTFWNLAAGTWHAGPGTYESNPSQTIKLYARSPWKDGFRPTKCRVEFTPATFTKMFIRDYEFPYNFIRENAEIEQGQEVTCVWWGSHEDNDIYWLQTDCIDPIISITSIAWLS